MALPIELETGANLQASIGAGGGLQMPGSSGVEFWLDIYQCSGLTSSYTRTLKANATLAVLTAKWNHLGIGGAGTMELVVRGGLSDMDTAVQNEWEIELKLGGTAAANVWYRGRIVSYRHEAAQGNDTKGEIQTRIFAEGYVTKLSQLLVTKTYAATTVAAVVTDLLDTYVTPNTRIAYTAADVVGAATVNSIQWKNRPLTECLDSLSQLQGSSEWGVSEGNPKPIFWFKTQVSTTKEGANFNLGKDVVQVQAEGSFVEAYNSVKVIGGWTGGAVVTGSATDATAQTAYGVREKVLSNSGILNATDANLIATNLVALYKDGFSRYRVDVYGPTTRVEPDRTATGIGVPAGTPMPVGTLITVRGVDGVKATARINLVQYEYQAGCPHRLIAKVQAGASDDDLRSMMGKLGRSASSLTDQVQQYSVTTTAHALLSATHSDTTAAAVARGAIITGQGASPTWSRLTVGTAGKFLRSDGTDLLYSTTTIPDTITSGGIYYASSANVLAVLAVSATTGAHLRSTGLLPAWSTVAWIDATTAGDLLYSDSANSVGVVNIGTAGKILRTTGTFPEWSGFTMANSWVEGDLAWVSASQTVEGLAIGATEGMWLRVSSGAHPVWSTSTLADTWTAGTLAYASATNAVTGLAVSTDTYVLSQQSSAPAWSSTLRLDATNNTIGVNVAPTTTDLMKMAKTHTATSGALYGINLSISAAPTGASSASYAGINFNQQTSTANNFTGSLTTVSTGVIHGGTGVITLARGAECYVSTTAIGNITTAEGVRAYVNVNAATTATTATARAFSALIWEQHASGTITTGINYYGRAPINSGTLTTFYHLYLESPTAAGTNWGIYALGGNHTLGPGNTMIGSGTAFGTSAVSVLALSNGTAPASSPSNTVQLWAEDVAGSHELRVRDEAGNVTTLSPHRFELFTPDARDAFPWSYYAENRYLGKRINVDMARAIAELERLSGVKLSYIENIPEETWSADQDRNAAHADAEEARWQAERAAVLAERAEWEAADPGTRDRVPPRDVPPPPVAFRRKSPPAWMHARGVTA